MRKRPKILVLGGLSMDLMVSTGRAPKVGETVVGSSFSTAIGGKGANQAVQCVRLGADVSMVGQVGLDSFGTELLGKMGKTGVDISCVTADGTYPTGVTSNLLEDRDGAAQKRTTVVPGANYAIGPRDIAFLAESVCWYDMLLLQLELPMEINELAAAYAKAAGVPVMLTPTPYAQLSPELLYGLAYLAPNKREASELTGVPIRAGEDGVNLDDVKAAVSVLLGWGVENVLITMGENGTVLANRNGIRYTSCVRMERTADPTAGGDSFVGAFCTALCGGQSQEMALAFASHAAALAVSHMGAMPGRPTLREVQELMAQRGCTDIGL